MRFHKVIEKEKQNIKIEANTIFRRPCCLYSMYEYSRKKKKSKQTNSMNLADSKCEQ